MYTHTFLRDGKIVARGNHVGYIYTWRGNEQVYSGRKRGLFVMGDRALPNYLAKKQYKNVDYNTSALSAYFIGNE